MYLNVYATKYVQIRTGYVQDTSLFVCDTDMSVSYVILTCQYVILTCQYRILTCPYHIRTVSIGQYLHVSAHILGNASLLLPPASICSPALACAPASGHCTFAWAQARGRCTFKLIIPVDRFDGHCFESDLGFLDPPTYRNPSTENQRKRPR